MRTIPPSFEHYRYSLSLIKREGNLAMYGDFGQDYFEVHRVRVVKAATTMSGATVPERETLARSSEFGRYGWACAGQAHADEVWERESGKLVVA